MPPANRKRRQTKAADAASAYWDDRERARRQREALLKTPVAELTEVGLPVRVVNTLEDHDVILTEDLLAKSYDDLMAMRNFGEVTLREVKAALLRLGLAVPAAWKKPR